MIGEIFVKGHLLNEASQMISDAFEKKGYLVDPQITLSIAQSKTVKIMGEVKSDGEYPYKNDMTILGLVASAGGFSYRADQQEFDIVRKKNDGTEELIRGTISTSVMPGDIIRVRERYF